MLIDKLLPVLVYPLGLFPLAVLMGLAMIGTGARRGGSGLIAAAVAGLYLCSTPLVAGLLAATLEDRHPPAALEAAPAADVIVLLGGLAVPTGRPGHAADLEASADRMIHAARLYRAGKAPRVLVTGGNLFSDPDSPVEADVLADYLVELGVERAHIVIERDALNTRQNAVNSAALWRRDGFARGLLVTSALHMPRALATFRKAGLDVVPSSTDSEQARMNRSLPFLVLPDALALLVTTRSLKEWIGLAVYRVRGWA